MQHGSAVGPLPRTNRPGSQVLKSNEATSSTPRTTPRGRTRRRGYPPRLGDAFVRGLWGARFLLDVVGKEATRAETAYVAGCLFRAVGVCAHALHGRAGRWLVNEKGAVDAAGRLPGAPEGFAAHAHGLLAHLGRTTGELTAALDAAAALVRDVEAACRA